MEYGTATPLDQRSLQSPLVAECRRHIYEWIAEFVETLRLHPQVQRYGTYNYFTTLASDGDILTLVVHYKPHAHGAMEQRWQIDVFESPSAMWPLLHGLNKVLIDAYYRGKTAMQTSLNKNANTSPPRHDHSVDLLDIPRM